MTLTNQNTNTEMQASLSRIGQDNATGDARALYLRLFSGEMFKGFEYNAIARDLVTRRTLQNGKSMQFLYTGRTKAEFHTPGNAILGNSDGAPPVSEKYVTVDDLLISSAFVYDLDETLAHYDLHVLRSPVRSAMLSLRSMTAWSSVRSLAVHVLLPRSLRLASLSPVVLRSVLALVTLMMLMMQPLWSPLSTTLLLQWTRKASALTVVWVS